MALLFSEYSQSIEWQHTLVWPWEHYCIIRNFGNNPPPKSMLHVTLPWQWKLHMQIVNSDHSSNSFLQVFCFVFLQEPPSFLPLIGTHLPSAHAEKKNYVTPIFDFRDCTKVYIFSLKPNTYILILSNLFFCQNVSGYSMASSNPLFLRVQSCETQKRVISVHFLLRIACNSWHSCLVAQCSRTAWSLLCKIAIFISLPFCSTLKMAMKHF